MAREITINCQLRVSKGNLQWPGLGITTFQPTLYGSIGPIPGAFTVSLGGTDINLSNLNTLGGVGQIINYDTVNTVTYGIKDGTTQKFYPLHDVLPGESYVFRISQYLHEIYPTSGTGSSVPLDTWHIKAHVAPCEVFIGVFDF